MIYVEQLVNAAKRLVAVCCYHKCLLFVLKNKEYKICRLICKCKCCMQYFYEEGVVGVQINFETRVIQCEGERMKKPLITYDNYKSKLSSFPLWPPPKRCHKNHLKLPTSGSEYTLLRPILLNKKRIA